jgi:hypothetical protein
VQGGYGVVFAIPVQMMTEDWRYRGTMLIKGRVHDVLLLFS